MSIATLIRRAGLSGRFRNELVGVEVRRLHGRLQLLVVLEQAESRLPIGWYIKPELMGGVRLRVENREGHIQDLPRLDLLGFVRLNGICVGQCVDGFLWMVLCLLHRLYGG